MALTEQNTAKKAFALEARRSGFASVAAEIIGGDAYAARVANWRHQQRFAYATRYDKGGCNTET